jgi:hypothetical protein
MGPFEFGNTTVRSGARLRDGLIAIQNSGKEGDLRERSGDIALIEMLAQNKVIDFYVDETYSVGRKWRSAMCKMGFLYDKYDSSQSEIGSVDFLTPNGKRLIDAESLAAQQESFLRAIAAMQLKFDGKSYKTGSGFSPFKHILNLMLKLECETGSSELSFIEFACFAQFEPSLYAYQEILVDIKKHRDGRSSAPNKKAFDRKALESAVKKHGRVAITSYVDYADENLRYLKTTGCFTSAGRGIAISPSKRELVIELVETLEENSSYVEYWIGITEGAKLPTDNQEFALQSLEELQIDATARGIPFNKLTTGSGTKDLNNARYDLEELIALNQELTYAHLQATMWEEILQYLAILLPRNSRPEGLTENIELEIPRGEGPAYLEWAVWRAFLAVNKLRNPPYESRKFKIDRDFLPINHAPGNGPDLVFEFDGYVLVVEVTLLTTDRQATAEQVGVRRHVYEIAKAITSKPVYCLFLAPSIKNETARDFRKARYEEDDGSGLDLTIIPLTLSTFMRLFAGMLKSQNPDSTLFEHLIKKCAQIGKEESNTAAWMAAIEDTFLTKTK